MQGFFHLVGACCTAFACKLQAFCSLCQRWTDLCSLCSVPDIHQTDYFLPEPADSASSDHRRIWGKPLLSPIVLHKQPPQKEALICDIPKA